MTKKAMIYEIVSNTTYSGIDEAEVNRLIKKTTKERIEEIYNKFVEEKEHANYFYQMFYFY